MLKRKDIKAIFKMALMTQKTRTTCSAIEMIIKTRVYGTQSFTNADCQLENSREFKVAEWLELNNFLL